MQHHLSHRFGVRLLVGTEYGPLTPPPARERHVLHRVALPLRRPLSAEGVPHSSGLRGEVGQLIRFPQPTVEHVPAARLGRVLRGREDRRDRKSTRLNSSHSQISYAVFCLKKKNISNSKKGNTTQHNTTERQSSDGLINCRHTALLTHLDLSNQRSHMIARSASIPVQADMI